MRNQKGFIQILLIAVLVLAIAGIGAYYYFVVRPGTLITPTNTSLVPQYQQSYQQAAQGVPAVNSASDLNVASSSLDTTDTTQIDAQLNDLNSAASF